MRFIHTSDWHLGRTVGQWSLLEEQRDFLDWLVRLLGETGADALLVSGDIYNRAVPPAEAVELLDSFLWRAGGLGIPVLMIAGNHDSPRRLSFGGNFLRREGVYIEGAVSGAMEPVTLRGAAGEVDFWLLPWFTAAEVRSLWPDEPVHGANEALKAVLRANPPAAGRRNVLAAHGFFADPGRAGELLRRDSEIWAGGGEMMDSALLAGYDYAGLGHLHSCQRAGAENAWYSGTPLKYSSSEAGDRKSVTLVELDENGVKRTVIPTEPARDLRRVRGTLEQLLSAGVTDDYIYAEVEDDPAPDMAARLSEVFPKLIGLRLMAREREEAAALLREAGAVNRSAEEMFADFYAELKGEELSGPRLEKFREALSEMEREAGER